MRLPQRLPDGTKGEQAAARPEHPGDFGGARRKAVDALEVLVRQHRVEVRIGEPNRAAERHPEDARVAGGNLAEPLLRALAGANSPGVAAASENLALQLSAAAAEVEDATPARAEAEQEIVLHATHRAMPARGRAKAWARAAPAPIGPFLHGERGEQRMGRARRAWRRGRERDLPRP
nr:hypothetical protein [Caldovatus aquaticus]